MAHSDEDISARLLAMFRAEAAEHLEAIGTDLSGLERTPAGPQHEALLEALFREVHTLKGAARSVGISPVEAVCQAAESLLDEVRRGRRQLMPPLCSLLAETAQTLSGAVGGTPDPAGISAAVTRLDAATADLGREAPEPAASDAAPQGLLRPAGAGPAPLTGAPPMPPPPPDTIRLTAAEFDAVLEQVENLLGIKLAAVERTRQARQLAEVASACVALLRRSQSLASTIHRASAPRGASLSRMPAESPSSSPSPALRRCADEGTSCGAAGDGALNALSADLPVLLRNLIRQATALVSHLDEDQRGLTRTVDSLDEQIRRLRLMPAAIVLALFPPMVQDLASERGKSADWSAEGAELEIDRHVLETVKEPLIHLVRNAIDHGIEAPPHRSNAGKPPRGRVALRLRALEGNRITVELSDDGAGVDLAAVRAAAVRAGFVAADEAEQLSETATLDLLYRSGLSTSPIITSLSGRGLGLAIVREKIERLGGRVRLTTQAGVGTTVELNLPASVAAFTGVLVRAGGQPFLLPVAAVERTLRVGPEALGSVEGREVITVDGQPVHLARLDRILGLPGTAPAARYVCILLREDLERLALVVDEVLGMREAVVKQFEPPLVRLRHVASAGLLGTGHLVLILRPADLLRAAERPSTPPPSPSEEKPVREPVILVVDDSITTRTMEKNLLEAAGYQVRVAADGVEGWTQLKTEAIDLVVSDIDMPRLDGFELTARIRADPKLAEIPVVLVTVLESRDNKERGIAVGANAYVVKSSFDQSNLLEIIHRLV